MTGGGCLTLNASFEPLTVTSWQRALTLVLSDKAEIVEEDGPRVRSESLALPRPAVIRLKRFVRVPLKFRRQVTNTFLFSRDGRRCAYCGRHQSELRTREFLTRDHVMPIARGGRNTWDNCVTACISCNNRKGDRTVAEARMRLRIVPSEPHMVHLVWAVRRLTPLQRKYVVRFFGEEMAKLLEG